MIVLLALPLRAQIIGNDASCDISVAPAATLLLPYFEIGDTKTTLFTVTNVSPLPQIAAVTLWSKLGKPVLRFDLQLTGYDVQSVDLRTVLTTGVFAAPEARRGSRSAKHNPDHQTNASARCGRATLPQPLRDAAIATLEDGIGSATIDVVAACRDTFPSDGAYYDDLLYDNVLIGDWMLVDTGAATDVAGSPLVHIRAIPEGGPSGSFLPRERTFYGRLAAAAGLPRGIDRRQPLPGVFAVGWGDGSSPVTTDLLIWREPSAVPPLSTQDAYFFYEDSTVLDARENLSVPCWLQFCGGFGGVPVIRLNIASTDRLTMSGGDERLPRVWSGDVHGWIFFDLHHVSESRQAWVVRLDRGSRFRRLADGVPLGNGCSPQRNRTDALGPL
ncbi:MAG TPA: hypothetical protein VF618_09315 [Thermoanaerobaculia bacterium]